MSIHDWSKIIRDSALLRGLDEREQLQKLIDQHKEPDYVKHIKKMFAGDSALDRVRAITEQSTASDMVLKALQKQESTYKRLVGTTKGFDSIRKTHDELEATRKWMQPDSASTKLIALLDESQSISERWEALTKPRYHEEIERALKPIWDSSIQSALAHAQGSLSDSVTEQIKQSMGLYERVNPKWQLPESLVDTVGVFKHLGRQIGTLYMPIIDPLTAKTIAGLLGTEGVLAQLRALGISEDGSWVEKEEGVEQDATTEKSRLRWTQNPEIQFLISLLLILIMDYKANQDHAEVMAALQKNTVEITAQAEGNNKAHKEILELVQQQSKQIEALSVLMEKAFERESRRVQQRFVVQERDALIYSKPESGVSVVGTVFPREVVRPVSEDGKWIEIEYFDWIRKGYYTGWALKKYFVRVPAAYQND